MNEKMRYAALFFAALFLLAGCTGVSKEAAFSEVQQQVDESIGFTVHWNGDTDSAGEVTQTIKELLSKSLVADAAVQIALLNNRRLQATYEEIGIAYAAVVEAGSPSNPAFHGGATFGLPQDPMTAHPVHDSYVFEIEMDFLSLLYGSMRKSVAKSEFEAAKLRVTAAVMDLAGQTRTAFYRVQAEKQMLEMFRQVVLATQAGYEFASELREAGNIPELDLLLQRALYEGSKLALVAAEVTLAESREQLNRLMGLWGEETAWAVEARLPNIPAEPMKLDDVEKVAIENSIDLAIAREDIVSIGKQLGVAKAMSLVPRLEVGGELEQEDGAWKAGPALGFEIPLFDRNQGQRAAAAAELRQRQEEYSALAVEIRSAVRTAHRRLLAARQTALSYQNEILPLQEKILEQIQLQYNAMQVGTPRLLVAKQQQIDAGRDYIQALYNYHVARAEFDQILNGRLVMAAQVEASPSQGNSTARHLDSAAAEGGH
jgi:cobalt-zinc-cadmium efflux system outer membrane protein